VEKYSGIERSDQAFQLIEKYRLDSGLNLCSELGGNSICNQPPTWPEIFRGDLLSLFQPKGLLTTLDPVFHITPSDPEMKWDLG
jgi:hypothetical protein